MQESFSEITRAELPLVIFNMARGQGDYYQSTRGGGHGDYRHIVLAPADAQEAVELTQLAFDLADRAHFPGLVRSDRAHFKVFSAHCVHPNPSNFHKIKWAR